MALFKPNLPCVIRKPSTRNVYGEETLAAAAPSRCTIVELKLSTVDSSVRADSSASRGAAEEFQGYAKLLFAANTPIAINHFVEVSGYRLRVTSVFPRHNLQGRLDHLEVEAGIWGRA